MNKKPKDGGGGGPIEPKRPNKRKKKKDGGGGGPIEPK